MQHKMKEILIQTIEIAMKSFEPVNYITPEWLITNLRSKSLSDLNTILVDVRLQIQMELN